jgi:hypothetical protein
MFGCYTRRSKRILANSKKRLRPITHIVGVFLFFVLPHQQHCNIILGSTSDMWCAITIILSSVILTRTVGKILVYSVQKIILRK